MNKLILIKNMGLKITWKLIGIGLFGCGEIPIVLSRGDVLEYLYSSLEENEDTIGDIVDLLCEENDNIAFDKKIIKLASDSSNIDLQKRKWKICLLRILIDNLSEDYMQGILEMMEFWVSMGISDDCPLTFPAENNAESVQNYFTQSSYEILIERNREWIGREVLRIAELDV